MSDFGAVLRSLGNNGNVRGLERRNLAIEEKELARK